MMTAETAMMRAMSPRLPNMGELICTAGLMGRNEVGPSKSWDELHGRATRVGDGGLGKTPPPRDDREGYTENPAGRMGRPGKIGS
jgi:hypothetical protein